MTSMNGVMLISLMTPPRRTPAPAPSAAPVSHACGDGHRQASRQAAQRRCARRSGATGSPRTRRRSPRGAVCSFADLGLQLVVGEHRRDRREEADGGREQRLRDAGGDDRKARVLRGGDGGEGVHDADDRAEKPDIGAGRADGGEDHQPGVEALDLALDRHVENLVDALREALARSGRSPRRSASTRAWRRRRLRRGRCAGAARDGAVELLERLAGPEHLLEAVHGPLGAGDRAAVLSMMIAQHQTEAASRPSITSLTTKWACQNRLHRERSCATGAAWATSAGFMSRPLSSSRLEGRDRRFPADLVRDPAGSARNLSKVRGGAGDGPFRSGCLL